MFNYERLLPNLDDSIANKKATSSSKESGCSGQLGSPRAKAVSLSSSAASTSSFSSPPSQSSSASSSSSSLAGQQQHRQTTQHQSDCPVHQRRQEQADQPVDPAEPIQQFTVQLTESRQSIRSDTSSIGSGQLFTLPPVIANSSLVRQRASAKDSLAAATVTTGASLPLMIGNRSKCVVNLLGDPPSSNPIKNHHHHHHHLNQNHSNNSTTTSQVNNQQPHQAKLPPNSLNISQAVVAPSPAVNSTSAATTVVVASSGPKNTALRAEQRKQNMVSVVRPVVNHQQSSQLYQHHHQQQHGLPSLGCEPIGGYGVDSRARKLSTTAMTATATGDIIAGEDQPFVGWNELNSNSKNHHSIIDEFMDLEQRVHHHQSSSIRPSYTSGQLDELLLSNRLDGALSFGSSPNHYYNHQQRPRTEQELKQDMILFRREEFELNRNIKKQHKFLLLKIEERKRNLQIIQSVWVQKDFKHAIEKLVDIYHQGLVFTCDADVTMSSDKQQQSGDNLITANRFNNTCTTIGAGGGPHATTTLSSMNTSLVVDVIGVIILRPKLWSLEICQLILPIIVNDLLLQQPTTPYENYIEVGLKSLKLILTHFSSVIKTTLESQKDSAKLVGVDLSREDRMNKCLNCYNILQEARSIVAKRCSNVNNSTSASQHQQTSKLNSLYRELQQSFNAFQASMEPNEISLFTKHSRRKQTQQ